LLRFEGRLLPTLAPSQPCRYLRRSKPAAVATRELCEDALPVAHVLRFLERPSPLN
jgi:hypothetical protein